jgi:hypothetical protein
MGHSLFSERHRHAKETSHLCMVHLNGCGPSLSANAICWVCIYVFVCAQIKSAYNSESRENMNEIVVILI